MTASTAGAAGATGAAAATVLPVGGASPYDVIVGHGVSARVVDLLGDAPTRVALVVGEPLRALAAPVLAALEERYAVTVLPVPDGESAKTVSTAAACWEALGEAGFTRSDAVVTFGGGATTDLGGFVAASWLRGVRVVHVPTTLLAMVDAAVGGKTGVNTGAGKNLVGAFHEPAGVLCDLALLASLPRAELVAGLGEVVKCGFIADPAILDLVEDAAVETILDPAGPVLRELVERAIAVKIDVVVGDLKEAGGSEATGGHPGREALNYGHTLAHAIERAEHYGIRHGEAVAIGCVYVAEVAYRVGLIDEATLTRHRSAFGRVGLPVGYAAAPFEDLLATMRVDKKSRGSRLRLIVLAQDGETLRPRVLAGPDEQVLVDAYAALAPGAPA
ncbi:3-dehydroquinate synthase [Nocardioides sp. TRM66260-LWL]|uniref:3-dehydroquinate synthase n=1 Tax=Nocardioides sp. TRM66260-LWL TaxID=2874478 RepID=UPI001CC4173E|nr:3-dehydroquinate synthase [Nocardioides sp. TRM66260-LWL]MBZ5733832.1 3-dehydroquinate synthase [Nocardioides sp. TRM66260-LWL]